MATLGEMIGIGAGASPPEDDPYRFAPRELPREMPMAAPQQDVGGTLESDLAAETDRIASLRRAQAASLTEHANYAAGLRSAQEQVDARGTDLGIAERLLSISDSRIPRTVRRALYDELSADVGIDPQLGANKRLGSLIERLDPDSLAGLRSMLSHRVSTSQPGQIQEFAQQILGGKVPLHQLMAEMQTTARTMAAEAARSSMDGRAQIVEQYGPPMGLGAGGIVAPVETTPLAEPAQATTEAAPTTGQAPTQPAAREKVLQDLAKNETEYFAALDDAVKLEALSRGNYDVLNYPPIRLPLMGTVTPPTGATARTAIEDFGNQVYGRQPEGTVKAGPSEARTTLPAMPDEGLLTPRQRFLANRLATRVGGMANENEGTDLTGTPPTNAPGVRTDRENSDINVQIRGLTGTLLEKVAKLSGESLARMTDADADRIWHTIVGSSNPDEVGRNLTNTFSGYFDALAAKRANALGERGPVNVAALSPDQIQRFVNSPVTPEPLKAQLRAHIAAQQQPPAATQAAAPVAPVAPQQPAVGPDGVPVRPVPTQPIAPQQAAPAPQQQGTAPAAPAAPRTVAEIAQAERAQQQALLNETRQFSRNAEARAVQSAELDVRRYRLQMDAAQEAKDQRAYQRARDAKQDAERRQARIQQLFSQIGALIAGGIKGGAGGVISSPGDGGDPNAFKMGVIPRRQGPTPAQARKRSRVE